MRPGEKLYEELLIGENPSPTSHPLIMKAVENYIPLARLEAMLDRLRAAMLSDDVCSVHDLLREIVPEFAPTSAVVDWVHMARAA